MKEKWCMKIEPARKLSSKGRASGGVIVGTKRNRKETVSLGETESECYVKIGKEIYLIPVYPNCNNYESYKERLENRYWIEEKNDLEVSDKWTFEKAEWCCIVYFCSARSGFPKGFSRLPLSELRVAEMKQRLRIFDPHDYERVNRFIKEKSTTKIEIT